MGNIQADLGLDNEQFRQLRLFNRILISYNDFKQAHEIAELLVEGNLYRAYPRENRHLVIALNMAAIVAYSRPFLNNRGRLANSRLPDRILKGLTQEQLEVHKAVLDDRNTMMAHSDADASGAIPVVSESELGSVVIPMGASPYARPLLESAMLVLRDLSLELQERCFRVREEMEPDVIRFLPRVPPLPPNNKLQS